MSLLSALGAAKHPYYCSDSNWADKAHNESFASMTDFLNKYEDLDPDLYLCFRWDVYLRVENDISSGYRGEVFIIAQRKGIFVPCMIGCITEAEAERFIQYAKQHWQKLTDVWNPIPGF